MERTTTLGSRRTRLLRRLELIDIPGCWDRMDALGRAREQTRAKPAYASAVTVTGSPLGGALLHVLGAERPRTLLRALRSPDHACAPRDAGEDEAHSDERSDEPQADVRHLGDGQVGEHESDDAAHDAPALARRTPRKLERHDNPEGADEDEIGDEDDRKHDQAHHRARDVEDAGSQGDDPCEPEQGSS